MHKTSLSCRGPPGGASRPVGREPRLVATTGPGTFAAGDVRSGTTQRGAFAVGDGAPAVACAHRAITGP